mmetsp:Transcript_16544/g.33829  ORF Transcript_16544/g.33829 Transcript_16544/m.33829 type:complete len:87 (+) Transcript_16544:9107-9367(+)
MGITGGPLDETLARVCQQQVTSTSVRKIFNPDLGWGELFPGRNESIRLCIAIMGLIDVWILDGDTSHSRGLRSEYTSLGGRGVQSA